MIVMNEGLPIHEKTQPYVGMRCVVDFMRGHAMRFNARIISLTDSPYVFRIALDKHPHQIEIMYLDSGGYSGYFVPQKGSLWLSRSYSIYNTVYLDTDGAPQ